jgi:hypothetical protein
LKEVEMNRLTQARLLLILHRAFVQARNLALAGEREVLIDLTDTFEVLPELIARDGEAALPRVRAILSEYQTRHPHSGYDYLAMLEMTDAEFTHLHGFASLDSGAA